MKEIIYLASPCGFVSGHVHYLNQVKFALERQGFRVFDPWNQDYGYSLDAVKGVVTYDQRLDEYRCISKIIGEHNAKALEQADHVLGIVDGLEIDSGVASEIGAGWGLDKRCWGLRTDVRDSGDFPGIPINLQVLHWIESSGGKLFRRIDDIKLIDP